MFCVYILYMYVYVFLYMCVFVLLHTTFKHQAVADIIVFSLPVFFSRFSMELDKNKPPSLVSSCLPNHVGYCYGNSLISLGNSVQLICSSVIGCPFSLHSISEECFCLHKP